MNKKTQEKTEDLAYDAANALLGLIPGFGPIAAYIFGQLVQSPLESRRELWMQGVSERLVAIEQHNAGFINSLKDNDGFLDVLYQANNMAMRNSQKQKLEALKNAVIHAATDEDTDYSVKQIYLRLVDELTPFHFRVLTFMHDPDEYYLTNGITRTNYMMTSYRRILSDASKEFAMQSDLLTLVVSDLHRMGLITINSIDTSSGNHGSVTTSFGRNFLQYISE